MELSDNIEKKRKIIIFNELLKIDENKLCSDCKNDSPSYANINLGVLICTDCSLCHMLLESNIKSLKNLEDWSIEELDLFIKINNKLSNGYWENNLKYCDYNSIKKNRLKLIEFIKNKYKYKKWVNPNEMNPIEKINKEKTNYIYKNNFLINNTSTFNNNLLSSNSYNNTYLSNNNFRQNMTKYNNIKQNINDTKNNQIYNNYNIISFNNINNNINNISNNSMMNSKNENTKLNRNNYNFNFYNQII